MFGMAGGGATDFAEMLEVVDGDLGITGQPQQRIEQHRAMARRQHKAVAVGPAGLGGVELQEARKQDRGDVRHAHRQARMPGFRRLHCVHGQRPDGIGKKTDFVLLRGGLIGQGHWEVPGMMVGGLSERLPPPSRAAGMSLTRIG